MNKDFTSVSPSALLLLRLKADTSIPYAKEASAIIPQPENALPLPAEKDLMYWSRVLHFEDRYTSISKMLIDLKPKNILELSSGFSFRGLHMAETDKNISYIDTDLSDVVAMKKTVVDELRHGSGNEMNSYRLQALQVLDQTAFRKITAEFPPGPVTFVNEGLLMYLNLEEKETLCRLIHETLEQRGGCWITADIYFRFQFPVEERKPDSFNDFLGKHHVQDNMFSNDGEARRFFESMGFKIEKINEPDYKALGSFSNVIALMSDEQKAAMGKIPKIRETWQLAVKS